MLLATLLASGPAAAEAPAAGPTTVPSARDGDGARDEDGDGVNVPGVVLMVGGGVAAGVGATILIVDAAATEPEPLDRGADPGIGGARGRAGQLPLEENSDATAVGAVLLGGGALVHLVGIVLVFGPEGDDDTSPPQATLEPLLGPMGGGLRGTF